MNEPRDMSWRPTPSMAVAMLSLFVALSGTAYALTRDEVRSRHIKNGHVRIADLDDEAVTNAKLGPLSVSSGKIQNNAVDTPQIADNAVDTPQIADSAVDTPEIAGSAVKATELGALNVRSNSVTVNAGQTGTATATCNAFEQVVAGGGEWANLLNVAIGNSEPSGNGWKVAGHNQSGIGQSLTAHAYCLEV